MILTNKLFIGLQVAIAAMTALSVVLVANSGLYAAAAVIATLGVINALVAIAVYIARNRSAQ